MTSPHRQPGTAKTESTTALHEATLTSLSELFVDDGWSVERPQHAPGNTSDLLIERRSTRYAVELKVSAEGRADRLIPLLAYGYLQAHRSAPPGWTPLVVVAAPKVTDRIVDQVIRFANEHAEDAAVGVIDQHGRRHFIGRELESLIATPESRVAGSDAHRKRANLFSDTNQWLLKMLLARYLPEKLVNISHREYRNATDLASTAKVSVMSAHRLLDALRDEGHLDDSTSRLRVVRRHALLDRWRAWSASRTPHELPAVFILPGHRREDLHDVVTRANGSACLGLFAAADALGLGFVKGAVPHVYVRRLTPSTVSTLAGVAPANRSEAPHLIIREALAERSIFGGAIPTDRGLATDVLQTWLDVSSHPTRGREQADMIEGDMLDELLGES